MGDGIIDVDTWYLCARFVFVNEIIFQDFTCSKMREDTCAMRDLIHR